MVRDEQHKNIHPHIKVNTPHDVLKGYYANYAEITSTREEVLLDFYSLNPARGNGSLVARIYVNTAHARRLLEALGKQLKAASSESGSQTKTGTNEIGFNVE